jgi:hypothetical protein
VGVGRTVGVGEDVGVGVEVDVGGTSVSVAVGSGICVGRTVGVTSVAVGLGERVGKSITENETRGVAIPDTNEGATTGLTWRAVTRAMVTGMTIALMSHRHG